MKVRRIIGQPVTSVDFRGAMDDGKIVIVRLPLMPLGEQAVNLLGTLIISLVKRAAFSREDIPDRKDRRPFVVIADEFHQFASKDFGELIAGGSKFGVTCVVAHQSRDG